MSFFLEIHFLLLGVIEKNAYSATQESLKDLSTSINLNNSLFLKDKKLIVDNRLNLISNFKTGRIFEKCFSYFLKYQAIFISIEQRRLSRGELVWTGSSLSTEHDRRMSPPGIASTAPLLNTDDKSMLPKSKTSCFTYILFIESDQHSLTILSDPNYFMYLFIFM